jgi:uncharacterized protein (UPF0276 family)
MNKDFLGFGLGLRTVHYDYILENNPDIDWFEILSENYMVDGGKPMYYLDAISEMYPLVMHGVSMSIGSTDTINWDYLKQLKKLIKRVKPHWISDHMCWTSAGGINTHDLLPMPYTEESINHIAGRVSQVQDFLGIQILLENVSSYLTYKDSILTEWDFLNQITTKADCKLLLDINNVYVSSRNHGFKAEDFIKGINIEHVKQIHLAGHSDMGTHVIDTHDHPVVDSVWELYSQALDRFGAISTMIERDDNIPEFNILEQELSVAKEIAHKKGIVFNRA